MLIRKGKACGAAVRHIEVCIGKARNYLTQQGGQSRERQADSVALMCESEFQSGVCKRSPRRLGTNRDSVNLAIYCRSSGNFLVLLSIAPSSRKMAAPGKSA